MVPLINSPNDQIMYQDVLVNPAELRNAELKAASSKRPPSYLLNKVLEMIFTKEELSSSKWSSGLNKDGSLERLYACMDQNSGIYFIVSNCLSYHNSEQNRKCQLKNKQ